MIISKYIIALSDDLKTSYQTLPFGCIESVDPKNPGLLKASTVKVKATVYRIVFCIDNLTSACKGNQNI